MASKKHERLKRILRKIEPEKLPPGFTALVMKEVEAEARQEVVVNPALKSLLKRTSLENPPADFTQDVMTRVDGISGRTIYEPIIGKKAWGIILLTITVLIVFLGLNEKTSIAQQSLDTYSVVVGRALNTVFKGTQSIPSLYLMALISLSVLLLMDYFVKRVVQKRGRRIQIFFQQ
jgi:hypothetical protein